LGAARFGIKNEFLPKSHVPSPTVMVSDEYDAAPGSERSSGTGAMVAFFERIRGAQLCQPFILKVRMKKVEWRVVGICVVSVSGQR